MRYFIKFVVTGRSGVTKILLLAGDKRTMIKQATAYVLGGDAYIYKLRGDGSIWREIPGGSGDLEMLDNNPATRAVTATSLNDDNSLNVFQLHGDGTIWQ